VLKYKIDTTTSLIAKYLVMILLLSSGISLFLLWGVGEFSSIVLFAYCLVCCYFVYSLTLYPFSCFLSDKGDIETTKPVQIIGKVSTRSFYNNWFMFLCVDLTDNLLVISQPPRKKKQKWFVIFADSVRKDEYRLFARLISSAH
jgi:hypothetical protein